MDAEKRAREQAAKEMVLSLGDSVGALDVLEGDSSTTLSADAGS